MEWRSAALRFRVRAPPGHAVRQPRRIDQVKLAPGRDGVSPMWGIGGPAADQRADGPDRLMTGPPGGRTMLPGNGSPSSTRP
jgi:hypothetical protein